MTFKQKTALRIGNGQHEETDSDLMRDGRGYPFIPGTSLAGIFRYQAQKKNISPAVEERLFGYVNPSTSDANSSAILFGDATLDSDIRDSGISIGRRDGIRLSEWGTVLDSSKFDFQIVETKAEYTSIIEWEGTESQYKSELEEIIEPILCQFIQTGIHVGARTSRGFGHMSVNVRKKEFEFPKDLKEWINTNPYFPQMFQDAEMLQGKYEKMDYEFILTFKMCGPFSIRVNTARMDILEDGTVPDSVPLENANGIPVIPGTSWGGAFRHHMHALLRDTGISEKSNTMKELDRYFGIGYESEEHIKSKLSFSESEIEIKNEKKQKMTTVRTALDRFTASPKTGSLFTSMLYVGGSGTLSIHMNREFIDSGYFELLTASICDLHLGLLSIGGEAAVGRGIMELTGLTLNGKDIFYRMLHSIEEGGTLNWTKEEKNNGYEMG